MLKKKGNDYNLTFVVFIGSLFFVLILGVIALHGIQQLVVNFAFPVVILSSWFRVLINVVMIQLVVIALHGIQQLVVNFAFPVVILSSWFLVLINVVMIKLVVIALHGIQQLVVNFAFPLVLLRSWFLVLIFVVMIKLVVIALHGIQQLVANFAFPVVLLSSWFLVLIFVDNIKNIGNINKGSINIFLFESRFVEKKNSLIGDNKTVYNVIVLFFYCNFRENLPPRSGSSSIGAPPFQNATQVPPASFLLPSLPPLG